MRDDMAKMLVETHRIDGQSDPYKRYRRVNKQKDPESLPSKEGYRRPYENRKHFGENFPPLKGFLRKNVGRPWNKVYSELSASLKGGGTVIEHTKLHLFRDFLETKPKWIGGKPYSSKMYSDGKHYPLGVGDFYVNRAGILMVVRPPKRKVHKQEPKTVVPIGPMEEYRKIGGVWYHLWYKLLPEQGQPHQAVHCKRQKQTLYWKKGKSYSWSTAEPFWQWCSLSRFSKAYVAPYTNPFERNGKTKADRLRYCAEMKQVSKKEIRLEGLNEQK